MYYYIYKLTNYPKNVGSRLGIAHHRNWEDGKRCPPLL